MGVDLAKCCLNQQNRDEECGSYDCDFDDDARRITRIKFGPKCVPQLFPEAHNLTLYDSLLRIVLSRTLSVDMPLRCFSSATCESVLPSLKTANIPADSLVFAAPFVCSIRWVMGDPLLKSFL